MYDDPIVKEVRQAGQSLSEQAKGDLHVFFQLLQEAQQQCQDRLVQAPLRELPETRNCQEGGS